MRKKNFRKIGQFFCEFVSKNPAKFDFIFRDLSEALIIGISLSVMPLLDQHCSLSYYSVGLESSEWQLFPLTLSGDTGKAFKWGQYVYLGRYHKGSKGHNVGRWVVCDSFGFAFISISHQSEKIKAWLKESCEVHARGGINIFISNSCVLPRVLNPDLI